MAMKKIKIAISVGDPAGIGPEVACKYAASLSGAEEFEPVFISHKHVINHTIDSIIKLPDLKMDIVEPDEEMVFDIEYGRIKPEYGKASMLYVDKAVDMALENEVDAVVTCPINKASIKAGGYNYPGHTEFLGAKTKNKKFLHAHGW